MTPEDAAELRALSDEALGLVPPGAPDPVPPWHRPRVRRPFRQRLAVWVGLALLLWAPAAAGLWWALSLP